LDSFFNPKSISVVGASLNPKKVGFAILKNIIDSGFSGKIYPVNLKEKLILGFKVYSSISSIKDNIDLAIIVIPSGVVLEILEECGQNGIKNVVIISAGFREIGTAGQKLERSLFKIAEKYGIKILGPNSLGFINNNIKLNASFTDIVPPIGPIAFVSQSGALCSAALDLAKLSKIGFSYFISLGNEVNFKELKVIEQLAKDKGVKVIAGYLEEISDGAKFIKVISKITKNKPVVLLKAGITTAGAAAVSSHTGALAGSYEGVHSLFKKAGVIEVKNLEDLLNISFCLAYQPIPKKFEIGIITNAGGPGVLTTDYCLERNLKLAKISSRTKNVLQKNLPPEASLKNPIDLIGDADSVRYKEAINALALDKNVSILIILLTPQAMTDIQEIAHVIIKSYKKYKKMILVSFMGGQRVAEAINIFNKNHIPHFIFPEKAIYCLKKIADYKRRKIINDQPYKFSLMNNTINKINNILLNKKGFLPINKIYDIFKTYRMPLLKTKIIQGRKQGLKFVSKIGYPVTLKIVSEKIVHKTDIGGVILNINSSKELSKAFLEIENNLRKRKLLNKINGFEISKMITEGQDVILGVKKDKLGHLIMFGWGGIYTEILNDVSFRLAPLNRKEAKDMISETKVYKVLEGTRTGKKYNIDLVIECLLKISDLVTRFSKIVELDINPLRLFNHDGKIIDIKMKIER
jgi:acetyltransferase